MLYKFLTILIFISFLFLFVGCAKSNKEEYIEFSIDVWDCRGEVPVLLSKDDAFAPTFVDVKFPNALKEQVKVPDQDK